jgi:hypothetical protein
MTGGNRLPLRSAARRRLSGRSEIFLVTTQTAVIREGVANGLTDPKRPFSQREKAGAQIIRRRKRFCRMIVLSGAGKGGPMAENRKLAAIMAADVVGFSRLTGADEDRTLARLRALRSDKAALVRGAADAAAARCRIAKHSASRST